jgi:hypothetical protein
MFRAFFSALTGFAIVTAAFAVGWIVVIAGPNADEARSIQAGLDRLTKNNRAEPAVAEPAQSARAPADVEPEERDTADAGDFVLSGAPEADDTPAEPPVIAAVPSEAPSIAPRATASSRAAPRAVAAPARPRVARPAPSRQVAAARPPAPRAAPAPTRELELEALARDLTEERAPPAPVENIPASAPADPRRDNEGASEVAPPPPEKEKADSYEDSAPHDDRYDRGDRYDDEDEYEDEYDDEEYDDRGI